MSNVYAPFMDAMKKFVEAQELMSRGPGDFYVKQMVGAYEYLMTNFAPFKIGDKAMLTKVPNPFPSGWSTSSHFIKVGALCEVHQIICDESGFIVDVSFDDESWFDHNNVLHPVSEDKSLYRFRGDSLVKIQQ